MRVNSELLKMARSRIATLTSKQAFVPIDPAAAAAPPGMPPGGAPPPGMPPGGAPPMGAPPMDPMAGGAPPMGAPPMGPMATAGAPPMGAPPMDPAAGPPMDPATGAPGQPIMVNLDDLIQLFMEVSGQMGGGESAEGASPSNEPEKPKGSKAKADEKIDQVLQQQETIMGALGLGGAPAGMPVEGNALAPEATSMGAGVAPPTEAAAPMPEMPTPPLGVEGPGMTVQAAAPVRASQVKKQTLATPLQAAVDRNRVGSISKVMNNLLSKDKGFMR